MSLNTWTRSTFLGEKCISSRIKEAYHPCASISVAKDSVYIFFPFVRDILAYFWPLDPKNISEVFFIGILKSSLKIQESLWNFAVYFTHSGAQVHFVKVFRVLALFVWPAWSALLLLMNHCDVLWERPSSLDPLYYNIMKGRKVNIALRQN